MPKARNVMLSVGMRLENKFRIFDRLVKLYYTVYGLPPVPLIKTLLVIIASPLMAVIPNKYYLMKTPVGRIYLKLREGPTIFFRVMGVYEYMKTRMLREIIKPGMTIVDIGASKGYYTMFFSKLAGNGRVISFEPLPRNVFWLKKSLRKNNYNNIDVFQCALSDFNGKSTFFIGCGSGTSSLIESTTTTEHSVETPVKTFDAFVMENKIKKVDLIKIDTEGAELSVLRGMMKSLRKWKDVRLAIDIHGNADRDEISRLLHANGFSLYRIGKRPVPIKRIGRHCQEIFVKRHV